MVRSIIGIRPHKISYVVYYMFRDAKRQAGRRELFASTVDGTCARIFRALGGSVAAVAAEWVSRRGKTVGLN
jgi:hypothetical protein